MPLDSANTPEFECMMVCHPNKVFCAGGTVSRHLRLRTASQGRVRSYKTCLTWVST